MHAIKPAFYARLC